MKTKDELEITITNPETNWVALDIIDSTIVIAEGKTPEEAEAKAKETGKPYILMFVPKKGETYIF